VALGGRWNKISRLLLRSRHVGRRVDFKLFLELRIPERRALQVRENAVRFHPHEPAEMAPFLEIDVAAAEVCVFDAVGEILPRRRVADPFEFGHRQPARVGELGIGRHPALVAGPADGEEADQDRREPFEPLLESEWLGHRYRFIPR
jgi:hypothetical protein